MERSGYKIKKIISENFEERLDGSVILYIVSNGWENVKKLADEEINQIQDEGIFKASLLKALVKTARTICQECDFHKDFLPFIINYLYIKDAPLCEISFYKNEVEKNKWEELMNAFDERFDNADINKDAVQVIKLKATITNV